MRYVIMLTLSIIFLGCKKKEKNSNNFKCTTFAQYLYYRPADTSFIGTDNFNTVVKVDTFRGVDSVYLLSITMPIDSYYTQPVVDTLFNYYKITHCERIR